LMRSFVVILIQASNKGLILDNHITVYLLGTYAPVEIAEVSPS